MEAQLTALYKECVDEYENAMNNELEKADVCFEDDELEQKHKAALEKAMLLVCICSTFLYKKNNLVLKFLISFAFN